MQEIYLLQQNSCTLARVTYILRTSLKELCYGCGEEHAQDGSGSFDEMDVWVGCGNCIHWFHTACVQEGYDDTPEFMCRSCITDDEGTTRLKTHQENSASTTKDIPENKYILKKLNRRIKRCQGCHLEFTYSIEKPSGAGIVVMHYENNPFYSKTYGYYHDAWRNCYYHLNITYITRCNSNFNGKIQVDKGISMTEKVKKEVRRRGFAII